MAGKRVTGAVVDLRVNEVYGRLVKGQSKSKILRECSESFSCSTRQVENYMAKARAMINDDCDMSRQALLAECLSGIREVRERASGRGQHQVELNAIRLMTELVGLTSS